MTFISVVLNSNPCSVNDVKETANWSDNNIMRIRLQMRGMIERSITPFFGHVDERKALLDREKLNN